jgi:drug/metabolite transporter (DMT)-like permease
MSDTTVPVPSAAPAEHGRSGPAIAAALVTVLLWASAFVAIRDAGGEVSAGPLSLGRLLVAAAVLGVIVAVRREALPPRADVPRLVLCGLLWFAAYNVVLNAAEQRVDAGTAAMLVNTGPILIALLAGLLLREGFPRTLLAGCAIAFAGAVVIGLATSGRGVDAGWGAALCLAAAAAYAGGVVAQKPLLERTSALQVTFLACVVGALACLPFAPALVHDLRAASAPAVAWTVYLGAFPTARLHHLGLRAAPYDRGPNGRDDVSRAADRRRHGLGPAGRGAARARAGGRRALPRGRVRRARRAPRPAAAREWGQGRRARPRIFGATGVSSSVGRKLNRSIRVIGKPASSIAAAVGRAVWQPPIARAQIPEASSARWSAAPRSRDDATCS